MSNIPEWAMQKALAIDIRWNNDTEWHSHIARALMSADREATERERERCKWRLRNAYDAGVLSWDIFEEIMRDIHSGAAFGKGTHNV